MSENQLKTVTGIVIKETKTKESDKIITVFSSEEGILNIYVPGAMRLKNKFHSAAGLFTYSEFVVFKPAKSDLYRLNEASVKHIFHALSENVEYLALAMYMAELLNEVNVSNDMNKQILRLFLNTLYFLTNKKWSIEQCKAVFEMRLLCDSGFRPNVIACKTCAAYSAEMFFFDIENAEMVCDRCYKPYHSDLAIAQMPTVEALRYIAYAELEKLFTFKLNEKYMPQLSYICEAYTLYHTKEQYKTLDFYYSVHTKQE